MKFTFENLVEAVIGIAFAVIVFGNIFSKAGYSRWYGVAMAIPPLNIVVIIWFAFSTWPIERKLLGMQFGDSPGAIRRDES
ncbi:MAG TPA: hypothetical protein VII95_20050 [Terriglobales bacterium]|jgi:hypothetical protein